MDNRENLLEVLKTIFRWKRPIILLCVVAGIGSIVISLFMSNYYAATTIFYAASADLSMPAAVGNTVKDRYYYGSESDIDRILTLAESNELADYIIKEYNLYKHYEIDTTHVKAPVRVKERFFKLYNVTKTKYDAIELEVEDKDPQMAAKLANAIRDRINQQAQQVIKKSQKKLLDNGSKSLAKKQTMLTSLADSLKNLRQTYGVYSYTQSETLTELLASAQSTLARENARKQSLESSKLVPRDTIAYVAALVTGLENQVISLEEQIKEFNEGMAIVDGLERIRQEATDQLGLDQEQFKQLEAAYLAEFPAILLFEQAGVPIIKSRPKRSYLVIGSVFIAFILGVLGVLIFDTYKDINWREIVNAK
ncbi:MAG: hypothetical protein AAGG75_03690 [Bacteroidota bacterium]